MRPKLLNKKLYIEGLRQIKTISIISFVITLIIGIAIPFSKYLNTVSNIDRGASHILNIRTDQALSFYYLFFLIFTPLMVLSLFRFLGRREESDFYHGIPQTRRCLFFSFSASIFTSLVAQITVVTGIGMALYGAFSKYLSFEPMEFVFFGLNTMILCFMIASVLLLAFSISGSILTAVMVFLILLLTPRIFIEYYRIMVEKSLPYLVINGNLPSIDNHLFFAFFHNIHTLNEFSISTLYTLGIGIFFYVTAAFSFHKRNSETAGSSMNSRHMQTIFRTLFAMILCLLPVSLLFNYYIERNLVLFDRRNMGTFYFLLILSYVVIIVAQFLYELLTTKNVKSALKTFRTLPLLAVLNVLLFLTLLWNFQIQKNYRIDQEKVEAVSVSLEPNYGYFSNDERYFQYALQNSKLTDEDIIALFCNLFNESADSYEDYLNGKLEDWKTEDNFYEITFQGIHKTFRINISEEKMNEFYVLVEKNANWKKIYTELPDLKQGDIISLINENWSYRMMPSQKQLKELYASLQQEVKEIPFSDWLMILNDTSSTNPVYLSMEIKIDGSFYRLLLPISEEITPKTYALFQEFWIAEHIDDRALFEESYQKFLQYAADGEMGHSNIQLYVKQKEGYGELSLSSQNRSHVETLVALRDQIKPLSDTPSSEDVLVFLNCHAISFVNYDNDYSEVFMGFYLPLNVIDDFFETIDY